MAHSKYPDTETEIASALILHLRNKNGVSTSLDIGKNEETAARNKARKLLKIIDTVIMNQTLSPTTQEAQNTFLEPYRSKQKKVDIPALLRDLSGVNYTTLIRDTVKGDPNAAKTFKKIRDSIESVLG